MLEPIYLREFITPEQEISLLSLATKESNKGGKERNNFQRWGKPLPYSSNFKSSKIPDEILNINLFFDYDSVSMNEYYEGQNLDYHFDLPQSGNKIYILSLLNEGYLSFKRKDEEFKVLLEPRSICVLQDELRWVWKHSAISSKERYSIVFRNSTDIITCQHLCTKCDSYHYKKECNS